MTDFRQLRRRPAAQAKKGARRIKGCVARSTIYQADGEWMDPDRFPLRVDGTVRYEIDERKRPVPEMKQR